jgi:hypothetical protein
MEWHHAVSPKEEARPTPLARKIRVTVFWDAKE